MAGGRSCSTGRTSRVALGSLSTVVVVLDWLASRGPLHPETAISDPTKTDFRASRPNTTPDGTGALATTALARWRGTRDVGTESQATVRE
jgi:hypothetical protein